MMTKKPDLKLIEKDNLTIKQRAFVRAIIKGKLGSQIDCYMSVYDVKLNPKTKKPPKHAHVDCSVLMSNPKIALAIANGMKRKETIAVASSVRTRDYVIERLYEESKTAESDASRVRSLELLGKSIALFTDRIEEATQRSSDDVMADIENKLEELLESNPDIESVISGTKD
tara:strand:- start:687 stop:1199 length:513 start_codon:yes stop_codon:yes gene_type:complete